MKVLDIPEIGPVEFHKNARAKHFRITIKAGGVVRVTVPRLGTYARAVKFVGEKQDWILKKQKTSQPVLSSTETEILREQAKKFIPERVAQFATEGGFKFKNITIKNMTTRWGSCSSQKNLNFSLHLMRFESKYIDYVIWHELSHTVHMNHGPKFWALLEKVCPGAKKLDREMRQKGQVVD